jgi:hypothetical protein
LSGVGSQGSLWFFWWRREKGHKATKAERSTKEIPNDEQGISNDEVKEKNHGEKRHKDFWGEGLNAEMV